MKPLLFLVVCFVCCVFLLFENHKQLSSDHLKKPVHSSFFHIETNNIVDEDMKKDTIGLDNNSLMKNEDIMQISNDNKINPSIGYSTHQKEISFNEILSVDESVSKGDKNNEKDKIRSDLEELQAINQENEREKDDEEEDDDEKSNEMENELIEHDEMEKEFVNQKEEEEKKEMEKEEEKKEMEKEEEKKEKEKEKEKEMKEEEEEEEKEEMEEMEKEEKEMKDEEKEMKKEKKEKEKQSQAWNTLQHQAILSHPSLSNNCSTLYWNCSSFYMHLGTLYSTFNTQSLIQSNYQSLQVQSTYPLLTSSLEEESERKLDFSFDDSWKQRFDSLQQEVYSNYLSTYNS